MLGNHLLEHFLRFFRVSGHGEFVGMVNATNDEFFIHSYREDGVTLLEFFVSSIVGVVVREY